MNTHAPAGKELAISNVPPTALVMGGFELMLPGESGQPGKVRGSLGVWV